MDIGQLVVQLKTKAKDIALAIAKDMKVLIAGKLGLAKVLGAGSGTARNTNLILREIQYRIIAEIKKTREWKEIVTNGPLNAQLGLWPADRMWVQRVLPYIAAKSVTFRGKGKGDSYVIQIGYRIPPYNAIFYDFHSKYKYFSKKQKQIKIIPWFKWLVESDEAVIYDHRLVFTKKKDSRSGQAVMVPSKDGEIWKMPSTYKSTLQDNFLTRAITNALDPDELAKIFTKALQ